MATAQDATTNRNSIWTSVIVVKLTELGAFTKIFSLKQLPSFYKPLFRPVRTKAKTKQSPFPPWRLPIATRKISVTSTTLSPNPTRTTRKLIRIMIHFGSSMSSTGVILTALMVLVLAWTGCGSHLTTPWHYHQERDLPNSTQFLMLIKMQHFYQTALKSGPQEQ